MSKPVLRLGTRGSPLALIQANQMRDALRTAHPGLEVEIVTIRTTGDKVQDRPLSEIGGKGLFTREIEDGLLGGALDIAVHSAKDMLPVLPEGLMLAAFAEREDPRDALISPGRIARIADLPEGATVATVALRRKALLLHLRPDLTIVPVRGNVDTRLRKLDEGLAQAMLLARAGLNRLGRGDVGVPVPVEDMLPAAGQGAICVECRAADGATRDLLAAINHTATETCVRAEFAMQAVLEGSCRTPIAGYAVPAEGGLWLRALVARPDGSEVIAAERRGAARDAIALGEDAGRELRGRAGPHFFEG
ncbi:MAG: hydroxymethylbilane synthase [Alphaproteobacteria bacterium]|nr:hydroxymethylbilane synthase [Alphaproteobacteria bacterium]MCW5741385.1 hydroxymethylbilane synthase [Alphaproteobacteria bacterium]